MKKSSFKWHRALLLVALFEFGAASAWCADFSQKSIGLMFAGDSRACVFFNLVGVPEADPAVPGSAWFVLPKTHVLFKESYAILLSAKLTSRPVNITTTGTINSCGHAEVLRVFLE